VLTRRIYLPPARWFDFWSGTSVQGPRTLDAAAAPLERIPLYVRAGSIVRMGPEKQWSTEKPEDPIELRIYAGADGDFTLYEDENDNYNYEGGAFATIPLHWDDARQARRWARGRAVFRGCWMAARSAVLVAEGRGNWRPAFGNSGQGRHLFRKADRRDALDEGILDRSTLFPQGTNAQE
jgi:alpha-D-xyloside xylohydrolase